MNWKIIINGVGPISDARGLAETLTTNLKKNHDVKSAEFNCVEDMTQSLNLLHERDVSAAEVDEKGRDVKALETLEEADNARAQKAPAVIELPGAPEAVKSEAAPKLEAETK